MAYGEATRGGRLRRLGCLICCVVAMMMTLGPPALSQTASANMLTSAGAVHSLPDAEARLGRPVKLRAMVTFYDPRAPESSTTASLFVRDASGGVWVAVPARPVLPLHEGTLLEVTGVTGPGDYAPIVTNAQVEILGQSTTPAHPPLVSFTEMATGMWDCQWVEVKGTIHTVSRVGRMESLRLATMDGVLVALTLAEDGVDYSHWIDAQVVVRGVSAPEFNNHRQMTGVHLFFPAPDDVQVLRAAAGDAFSLPVRAIARLAQFDAHATVVDRVHIRGRVTLGWPGRLLCVQDSSGGLCVEHAETETVAVGGMVDVAGYPVFAAEVPALMDATARPARDAPLLIKPRPSNSKDVFEGQHAGELLSVEGDLVGVGSDGEDWLLTLMSQGVVFTAVLPRSSGVMERDLWRPGSYVRVTGICVSEMEKKMTQDWSSLQRLHSFRILLRDGSDVEVLRYPSWWTHAHTMEIFSAGLVVTLAGFGWVMLLRRRVEEKTYALRESEERFKHLALHDALTGVPNRAKFYDRASMAIHHAQRFGGVVGMMLLDMDNFKPINDTLGHQVGDRVLCELTRRVSGALRKVDTVARLGGDEFAVVLCELSDPRDAELVGRKILDAVCQPLEVDGVPIAMSVSIGICVFPEDGRSVQELLQNADSAMYESKRIKRGGIRLYRRRPVEEEEENLIGVGGLS